MTMTEDRRNKSARKHVSKYTKVVPRPQIDLALFKQQQLHEKVPMSQRQRIEKHVDIAHLISDPIVSKQLDLRLREDERCALFVVSMPNLPRTIQWASFKYGEYLPFGNIMTVINDPSITETV